MNKFIYKESPTFKRSQQKAHQRFLGASVIAGLLVGMTVWCSYRDTTHVEAMSDNTEKQVVVTQEATSTPQVTITSTIAPKIDVVAQAQKIVANRYADSPLLKNNRLQTAFDLLGKDEKKFKIFIAIAGKESAFGQSWYGQNCNNYWGYLYTGTKLAGCYSSKWSTPDKAIARYIELEKNGWLAKFDGTKSSLDLYDNNHGNYCGKRDDCENWKKDIWWFIGQFDK